MIIDAFPLFTSEQLAFLALRVSWGMIPSNLPLTIIGLCQPGVVGRVSKIAPFYIGSCSGNGKL